MNDENKYKRTTIYIKTKLLEDMKIYCVKKDITLKEFISKAIEEKMNKE